MQAIWVIAFLATHLRALEEAMTTGRGRHKRCAAPMRRLWRGSQEIREQFVGQSPVFHSILEFIETVACRECPVIITGETGTGKEMIARRIHAESRRSKSIFVPVDCTTLSGQLLESQLFGHVKGSFTGAVSDTLGFFRAAHQGTIFLDEIGELSIELQAKLLRVLEESCVTPLGATQAYSVDVRVICATNHNLRQAVHQGKFRADLYYRLNVVQLEVPPLRARKDDVVLLADYFLGKQAELYDEPAKKLAAPALKLLTGYSWPGNVRELANVMERAYVMSRTDKIGPSALPTEILTGDILAELEHEFPTIDEANRKLILRALQATNGRKMAAAKLLRIDHRRLNRLMKKYNLSPTYE